MTRTPQDLIEMFQYKLANNEDAVAFYASLDSEEQKIIQAYLEKTFAVLIEAVDALSQEMVAAASAISTKMEEFVASISDAVIEFNRRLEKSETLYKGKR